MSTPLFLLVLLTFEANIVLCDLQFHHYTVDNFPNPQNRSEYERCGLSGEGVICDPDSLLTRPERDQLNEWVKQFPEWTKINVSKGKLEEIQKKNKVICIRYRPL